MLVMISGYCTYLTKTALAMHHWLMIWRSQRDAFRKHPTEDIAEDDTSRRVFVVGKRQAMLHTDFWVRAYQRR